MNTPTNNTETGAAQMAERPCCDLTLFDLNLFSFLSIGDWHKKSPA